MRRTQTGKVVGSYRMPSQTYTVQTHPGGFAVHYPSGAIKRVFSNEGDAAAFAWSCAEEWSRYEDEAAAEAAGMDLYGSAD